MLHFRYNVDCSASESFYGLAENAFGNEAGGSGGNSGGQCPNANPLSDAECEGKLSNCWSPGNCTTRALLVVSTIEIVVSHRRRMLLECFGKKV